MELRKQLAEQEVKVKATAPDEKRLAALRKTVAANKKGTTAGTTQGSHSHGKACKKILSLKVMENGEKIVRAIENILRESWNFSTAYHESRTRSSDNSISIVPLQ